MDVHVRGIDPEVWRALRVEAVQRGISVAQLLAVMWHDWPNAISMPPTDRKGG